MSLHHVECRATSWFRDRGIETINVKAADRRNTVESLYGSWFRDHGLKLTRDYMVTFEQGSASKFGTPYYYETRAHIEIFCPKKAVLFKLTWVGV